ncbi:retrovirus-related Pol polyprotein from transposon 17.6 [Trichonephila clavipes]|nr:retrovirus-related Pol polyprotein from transposon 17.6 [Trichonephila clavipes]
MPKVGICTHLPFLLILGFDWQPQVQARCSYDSKGALYISTPFFLRLYKCIHASKPSIHCIASNEVSLPPLEDVALSDLNTKILPSQAQLIPKFAKLSTIQQAELDAKWLQQEICRPSNSTYAAPAFIVEQPFHESTPRRVVTDYSRTINSITKLDLHPIDYMEDVIKRIVGKCYISKMDVKSAFNTIRIRETDIFKTGFVTPDRHYEFLRMSFGVTNGPFTMTRAIKLAFEHIAPHNVNTYIDDISTSHDDFSYHLKVLNKILEATRNAGFKLIPGKTQLAVSEIALFGRIFSLDGERPDPDRRASVQRYSTLKSIHEVRSFLGFSNHFRKHIQNYAVIAKPLKSVLKGLGAVLSQDQNGKRRVIEYASRTLKDAEARYHSNEAAIHWTPTEKFRLYLLGHKFQLITDNYTTAYVVAKSAFN